MASRDHSPDHKIVPGLGIAQRGSVGFARQTSHHGLIENAAPIGGRPDGAYYDGSPSERGWMSRLSCFYGFVLIWRYRQFLSSGESGASTHPS